MTCGKNVTDFQLEELKITCKSDVKIWRRGTPIKNETH